MKTHDRDLTIDIAKGIAIIAIVLGHVLRGLAAAGIIDQQGDVFSTADRFLYTFHLSVFAFLAALFVRRAVERDGPLSYLRSRDVTFLYLYVVWSLLQGAVKLLTGALVNNPTSLSDIFRMWEPEGQLWFLPWLIIMTSAVVLVRPWRGGTNGAVSLTVAAVVSIGLWGISGPVVGTQGLGLLIFFFSGAIWGARRFIAVMQAVPLTMWWVAAIAGWVGVATLVFFTGATPPTIEGGDRTPLSVVFGIAASVSGLIAVIATSRLLASLGSSVEWLAFIGKRTLEIFLAHIIAASGTRIILSLAGIDNPAIHIVVGTVAGIVLPLLLWRVCVRLSLPWLFAAPHALDGKRAQRFEPDRVGAS